VNPVSRRFRSRVWRVIVWTALSAGALILPGTLPAFAPGGFAFFPGTKTHVDITEDALQTIYDDLGITKITKSMKAARKQITEANKEVDKDQHSSAKHFDGENFTGGQLRVTRLIASVIADLQADDAETARDTLGGALHTVQDFYAHSSWVEIGNGSPSGELGRDGQVIGNTAPPGVATCVEAPADNPCFKGNLTTSLLTSGYYAGEDRVRTDGKCRHGGFFDHSPGRGGINKDSSICIGVQNPGILDSPHNDSNGSATQVATAATVQIFRDIKAKVTERQFKALLGIGPSLAFAIDTTGSMGSIINGVRASAIAIVDARIGTAEEPGKYVLSPFNDPFTGPVTTTSDPDRFKASISSLFASGGDDCPELSMQGAFGAVAASEDEGDVFLFTDASSKDAGLAGAVFSLAASKKVRVTFSLFGSCSPFDPAYFFLANGTGGNVFILGRNEAGTITKLADVAVKNDAVAILATNGNVNASQAQSFTFPVDTQTSRVNFIFSTSGGTAVTITRPGGAPVSNTDADVSVVPISLGRIVSVKPPAAGNWTAVVSGTGDFSFVVTAESALSLDSFEFVELGGREGHQGYYPITGLPAPGATVKALARLSGNPLDVAFEFRDALSQTIGAATLADPNAEPGRLIGAVTIPDQSFRIYAVGHDGNGALFQRVIGSTVVPAAFKVVAPLPVALSPNLPTTYIFQLQNGGAADTFNFTAVDSAKFISSVAPASATVPAGGTVNIRVRVATPATARIGTSDTLTFLASSATQPGLSNFAVLRSSVEAPPLLGDVNRDGVVNCEDLQLVRASFGSKVGQSAFNPDVDLDASGVVDVRDLAVVARQLPAGTVCN